MNADRPSRRDLMKPAQLLGLAFISALFAGVVTLVSMGFFQAGGGSQAAAAVNLALIMTGIVFIAVLLLLSLLLLATDPKQIAHTVDRPVLYDDEDDETPTRPDDLP